MINHIREGGGSTDSEELALAGVKETTKKKRRKSQTNRAERKGKTVGQKEGAEVQNQVAEVTQRSTTTENCDDEASTVQEEQKTARNGPALQTEQLRSKKGKNLGEWRLMTSGFTSVRRGGIKPSMLLCGDADDL